MTWCAGWRGVWSGGFDAEAVLPASLSLKIAGELGDALAFQGGGGGVEVFEGALPGGTFDEVAGVGEEEEAAAGAGEGEGEVLRVLTEGDGAVRMAAGQAEEDRGELALAELLGEAERDRPALERVGALHQ